MKRILPISGLMLLPATFICDGSERPNILWLTFEDTSYYEFGCYGNKSAKTPVIDSLIREGGIVFNNAYSCGPQSSPARSTLITGCYSTTYAMDWHRKRVDTPEDIFFPQYLRDAGYYCTNNKKTDYNSTASETAFWDECSTTASYNSPARKAGQPFFAVFNSNQTHMSRLTSTHTQGRRNFAKEGLAPKSLELPPYVPDLYEVRSDYALHLEGVQDIDSWVKIFLDDLKAKDLDSNTIIFIFSDHGGCLPRGKAFSYESSFRVPMIAYIPPAYRDLAESYTAGHTDRLVSFADMGPTMLSLAGISIPEYMQGSAFMGEYEQRPREYQIGYMCNRASHYIPSRTISDGRYKYIRYYIPYKKDALFNYFQWQMPANLYWDKAYLSGKCDATTSRPYEYAPSEALYDLEKDPYELENLIADKQYNDEAGRLRDALSSHIRKTCDIGFIPDFQREGNSPYDYVRTPGYDIGELYALVELTLSVEQTDIPRLTEILSGSASGEFKYWATVNMAVLASRRELGQDEAAILEKMLQEDDMIAQEAAYALCHTERKTAGFDYLAEHPENTTALEILSLEKGLSAKFPGNVMKMLYAESDKYQMKERKKMPGGNDGIGARKVLVNLGKISAEDLYGDKVYEIGLQVNRIRKKAIPLPY